MSKGRIASLLAAVSFIAAGSDGQWLKSPMPGIPRTSDGTPDLAAPAPRTADGKPDLSGVWQMRLPLGYVANIVADLDPSEILPWAATAARQRQEDFGREDPWTIGCLPGGPRMIYAARPALSLAKIIQTPHVLTILYEDLSYRQIFLDGRQLPREPNPSFMGYSVGRWEGDTLVAESLGFNERTWLDFGGHPHTEALRLTERFRRRNVGEIDLQVMLEDKGAYSRPWTVSVAVSLAPETDLLEYVCNENESRRRALSGRTEEQKRIVVPAETLAKYTGRFVVVGRAAGIPFKTLDVRLVGGELMLDIDGRGSVSMLPLSSTLFTVRLFELEFKSNELGAVTEAVISQAGVRLIRQ